MEDLTAREMAKELQLELIEIKEELKVLRMAMLDAQKRIKLLEGLE